MVTGSMRTKFVRNCSILPTYCDFKF